MNPPSIPVVDNPVISADMAARILPSLVEQPILQPRKHCRSCNEDKPESEWQPSQWALASGKCRTCVNDYVKNRIDRIRKESLEADQAEATQVPTPTPRHPPEIDVARARKATQKLTSVSVRKSPQPRPAPKTAPEPARPNQSRRLSPILPLRPSIRRLLVCRRSEGLH
jgi:hypothetical protein